MTNLIVGKTVQWEKWDGPSQRYFRGRVLDAQLNEGGVYRLLVQPLETGDGPRWRPCMNDLDTKLANLDASEVSVVEYEDEDEALGAGYRRPAE